MTRDPPLVTVVIPHYLGDVLHRCVASVLKARQLVTFEIVIVDDQPFDDASIARARTLSPALIVTKTHGRHGFGTACNAGIAVARGRHLVFLNNDAVVTDGFLDALVLAAEADPRIGVLQAKVRSFQHPERFDYSGGAGGLMDWLGYPFALGRVFDAVEVDFGQYDESREIFWAVGCAMLVRRFALDVVGRFDEAFYMHMEEIDLCWRMHAAGFRVKSCPAAVVFHEDGHTLKTGSFRKAYCNHRNNLILLMKHLPVLRLLQVLPIRIALEFAAAIYGFVTRDWRRATAPIAGMAWILGHLPQILSRRRAARSCRVVCDRRILARQSPRSIVVDHFLHGRWRNVVSSWRTVFSRAQAHRGALRS